MKEGGRFSLSIRTDERDALVTVVDDAGGISNELLLRALEMALAKRGKERAYSARMSLASQLGQPTAPPLTYGAVRCKRILVVDDHVDAAQSLALLLRRMGHDVQVVHDGHAALEAARLNRPQLVLLDLTMPGVDGYRVVERLRADPGFARVHFIAVSGSDGEDKRRRTREAGFTEHLVKPVNMDTLRKLLERL
jgi:CheY-like chemotaxis protein